MDDKLYPEFQIWLSEESPNYLKGILLLMKSGFNDTIKLNSLRQGETFRNRKILYESIQDILLQQTSALPGRKSNEPVSQKSIGKTAILDDYHNLIKARNRIYGKICYINKMPLDKQYKLKSKIEDLRNELADINLQMSGYIL